jgi:hypothetical protein
MAPAPIAPEPPEPSPEPVPAATLRWPAPLTCLKAVRDASVRGRLDRRAHHLFTSRLLADYAQLRSLYFASPGGLDGYVSDVRFDHTGELIASCSTEGRVAIHMLSQFADSITAAEAEAEAAAEAAEAAEAADAAYDPAAFGTQQPAHSPACDPIFAVSTRLSARAARWDPHRHNEIVVAFANSHELRYFDLGAARPGVAARTLRSASSYGQVAGVHDLVHLPESSTVLAGGRDGKLRLWDVRAAQPLVHQSAAATTGWTLGVRAQDVRAGAIAALAASPDGAHVYSGSDEGVLLGWDVRSLNTPAQVVRVGRALGGAAAAAFGPGAGGAGSRGMISLTHHPSLREMLCVQMSSGRRRALLSLVPFWRDALG